MKKYFGLTVIAITSLSFTYCLKCGSDSLLNPTDFTAESGTAKIDLAWKSGDPKTSGYLLIRGTKTITFKPTNGETYKASNKVVDGETAVFADIKTSFTDEPLNDEDVTYHYRLYSYDDSKNYSEGVAAEASAHLWNSEAYLKPPYPDSLDHFGNSVAISEDTIVVGSPQEASIQNFITNGDTASADNSALQAGGAFVYRRTGDKWKQEAFLKPSNMNAGDKFGYVVAISHDTIAIGAYLEDSSQTSITNGSGSSTDNSAVDSGATYIFKRTGNTWAQEAYLKPSNGETLDKCGYSVGISDDTVVVGCSQEDSNQTTITNGITSATDNNAVNSGAAFVYKRTGTTWAQEAYLKAPNAGAQDTFGIGVAIDGDTIVVGATHEDSKQTTITNGETASSDNSVVDTGAAYVFRRTGTTWKQEAYLKAPTADTDDRLGAWFGISGDTIVIGNPQEDSKQTTITNGETASADNSETDSGAAYVFQRNGNEWKQEAFLKPSNNQAGNRFGYSVGISGDTIIVGAFAEGSKQTKITNGSEASTDLSAADAGAAYVFRRTGDIWVQDAYLKAPNAEAGDEFGTSVAIENGMAVVGAQSEDSNQTTITNGASASSDNSVADSGAAYIFRY
jgi:hypothetical protein